MLDRFLAGCFHDLEMKLIVENPVIGHVQNCAIF
jgi:hypothetical protein